MITSIQHLQLALNDIAREVGEIYKRYLYEYNKVSSGKLIQSINKDTFQFVLENNVWELVVNLPDEAYYIENGRRPGKFPPIDKIREWIIVRRLLPKARKDIPSITLDQLTFLVSRGIARNGIKATPILDRTIQTTEAEGLTLKIQDKIAEFLESQIENEINNLYENG